MAKDETKRMKPAQIEADKISFAALQAVNGYDPANVVYSLANLDKARASLDAARADEAQTAAAAATARDNAVAKEWEFHNLILGAKDQVIAQFGRDSNEVQAVGLKKASEYRAPRKRTTKDTQPTGQNGSRSEA